MYRASVIQDAFLHLVGWRQHYNTAEFSISDSLLQSESGIYMQGVHPLLTLENIKANAPLFSNISYSAYSSEVTYRIGDRVTYDGHNYRCVISCKNKIPDQYTAEWERFDPLSEWLENKMKDSIANAVSAFYNKKMSEKTLNNILENKALFTGAGRIGDIIPNTGSLCGFEIVPIRAKGVNVKINRIGLQFSAPGDVKMYLFHSSQSEPLGEYTFTRTKSGSMEWFVPTTDIYLSAFNSVTDTGGSFYLVYDQDELPIGCKAINKDYDWSSRPCGSCNGSDYAGWSIWSRYLEIHPFKVDQVDSSQLWDISDNVNTYTTNYGINLDITISCDITELVVEQKLLFANLISLQIANDIIRGFVYNSSDRINREQVLASKSQQILYELDGDSQGYKKSGLKYELSKSLEAVSLDIRGMSKVCFPCGGKGLKYRTV